MPLYEYRCDACGHHFEQIQKFSDPPVDVCPNCGERKVQKLLSSPAIQFKGSGWYITDYARKGTEAKESKESKEAKPTTNGGDAKPAASESKSTGTESKSASSDSGSSSTSSGSSSSTPASSKQ